VYTQTADKEPVLIKRCMSSRVHVYYENASNGAYPKPSSPQPAAADKHTTTVTHSHTAVPWSHTQLTLALEAARRCSSMV
jgi:hypothetical protein